MALRATRGFPPNVGRTSGSGSTGTMLVPTTVPTWFAPIEFNYTQFTGFGAASGSITLASLVIRGTIHGLVMGNKVAFAGAGITTLDFSVGITGNTAKYLSPFNGFSTPGLFADTDTQQLESFVGATTILLTAVTTGANLSALTAGVGVVYIMGAQLVAP